MIKLNNFKDDLPPAPLQMERGGKKAHLQMERGWGEVIKKNQSNLPYVTPIIPNSGFLQLIS
jgi:hypothetical protein